MNDRKQVVALLCLVVAMLLACVWAMFHQTTRRADLAATKPVVYRIDPNQADADTLCLLPRIGPGIAQRLIDDRQAHGPYRSADELARVPMIGEKTVAALRPWIRIDPTD